VLCPYGPLIKIRYLTPLSFYPRSLPAKPKDKGVLIFRFGVRIKLEVAFRAASGGLVWHISFRACPPLAAQLGGVVCRIVGGYWPSPRCLGRAELAAPDAPLPQPSVCPRMAIRKEVRWLLLRWDAMGAMKCPAWTCRGPRCNPAPTWASASRGSARSAPRSASRSASRTKARSNATRYKTPATKCTSCARAVNGKTARSPAARKSFQASHPCPATHRTSGACPGYVIDHVIPLKRGGADSPANMEWQSLSEAKAKDKVE
jgi:hypothetical protein